MAQTHATVQPASNDHTDNWSLWRANVHDAMMVCNELYGRRMILRHELADTGFDMTHNMNYYDDHPNEYNQLAPGVRARLIRINNIGIIIERHAMGAEIIWNAIRDAIFDHEDKMKMEAAGEVVPEGGMSQEGPGRVNCYCGGYHDDQSNDGDDGDESDDDWFVSRW